VTLVELILWKRYVTLDSEQNGFALRYVTLQFGSVLIAGTPAAASDVSRPVLVLSIAIPGVALVAAVLVDAWRVALKYPDGVGETTASHGEK